MRNLLHDRVDQAEDFRDRARDLVERAVKEKLASAMRAADNDISKALELLAAYVGDLLAELTTQSVQAGFDYAVKRGRKSRGV